MAKFKQKRQISGQSLGERLRKLRQEQGKTLEEVATSINIQAKYLEFLENGDYIKLPGDVYARVWIKQYAGYLGISPNDLLVDYKTEKQISEKINKIDSQNIRIKSSGDSAWLRPRNIKLFIIALVIMAVLSYLTLEINNIISPPVINILAPTNNFVTVDGQIKIVGQTVPEAELIINGERVLIDEAGKFEQTVNLANGLNKLKISAKKKHSRTSYLEWNILRE